MNILRLYLRVPPERGGMENHVKRLSKEQIALGHQVTLGFNRGEKLTDRDLQVLSSLSLINMRFGTGVFLFHLAILFSLLLKPAKYDICHIHGDWHSLLFGPIYRFITRGKIVFSFHGAFERSFITHKYILTRILRIADLVLVNGTESFNSLKPFHDFIHLRSSGVEDVFFKVKPKQRTSGNVFKIVTVANLNPVKNLETLIKVAIKAPSLSFYIYGDGSQRQDLMQRITMHGIKNVTLGGFLSRSELVKELATADAFLLTSLKEGTPTVVLEAMAARVPVVASNAGGLIDFLEPDTAAIVNNPLDTESYLSHLTALCNNNAIRMQRIEKAHIFSQLFSWRRVAVSVTGYMKEII